MINFQIFNLIKKYLTCKDCDQDDDEPSERSCGHKRSHQFSIIKAVVVEDGTGYGKALEREESGLTLFL